MILIAMIFFILAAFCTLHLEKICKYETELRNKGCKKSDIVRMKLRRDSIASAVIIIIFMALAFAFLLV